MTWSSSSSSSSSWSSSSSSSSRSSFGRPASSSSGVGTIRTREALSNSNVAFRHNTTNNNGNTRRDSFRARQRQSRHTTTMANRVQVAQPKSHRKLCCVVLCIMIIVIAIIGAIIFAAVKTMK